MPAHSDLQAVFFSLVFPWNTLAPPTSHQCDPNASPTPLHWVHWVQQDLSKKSSNDAEMFIGFVGGDDSDSLTWITVTLGIWLTKPTFWRGVCVVLFGMALYGNVELTLRLQHSPNNEEMPLASSPKQFLRVQPTGMIWNENSGALDRFENKFDCKHVHTFSQTDSAVTKDSTGHEPLHVLIGWASAPHTHSPTHTKSCSFVWHMCSIQKRQRVSLGQENPHHL